MSFYVQNYSITPNAAIKPAAKIPTPYSWPTLMAKLLADAVALAVVAVADVPLACVEVAGAELEADVDAATAAAWVALRLPHTYVVLHAC